MEGWQVVELEDAAVLKTAEPETVPGRGSNPSPSKTRKTGCIFFDLNRTIQSSTK